MGGDYTRWTFNPRKDYKSVFKQQGRVDVDADWNELVEITDRRWRTESMDIAGQDFVSEVTPDAFLVTPVGTNDFTIGIGRLYVDGLVAECHGLPPAQFDPILGEMQRTNPVKYSNQPYLPSPLPPVIGAPNTTDLIYLDVWEREVTAIQDPHIREIALAGPDTCTRLQTVWQAKDLPNVGQHACGDDIPAWDNLIAPSAGRLTTSTVPPNPSATPCILSQTGGYTGLENRLYRVEIHVAGTLDGAGGTTQAQFKWSRDNASVVAAVTGISASGGTNSLLNVTTLGRDDVLRFNVGDWVEILDDYTEFQGIAGYLVKILNTDAANLTITVNPPVPAAFNFNPGDPTRHTRVRRWDGRADVNSDVNASSGLILVGAGPIAIEQGIQVSFSVNPAGGSFKVGDYWIFAARTFNASVETLVNAPPRGILHHYCRLGFITWDANGNGTFSDCRPTHKCECGGDCSVTVGDGISSFGQFTDIQKAINSLGPAGGVVCVARGVYIVEQTITITDRNGPITLVGMGNATRVILNPGPVPGPLLNITETSHIRVEGFFMATLAGTALIEIEDCSFCTIRDCTLVNLHIEPAAAFGLGSASAAPSACAIALSDRCVAIDIRENALLASKGIFGATVLKLSVRDNDFLAYQGAVFLDISNGLEIQYNLMRGLSAAALKDLQGSLGGQLSAGNITAFQNAVTAGFVSSASGAGFMGTGIFLLSAFDANISHNRIAAQAAIVTILAIEATFDANEILAFIGFLSLFAIDVRVANSLIAGLLIGYLQFGIVIDFVCEGNFWLGFLGVVFLPFGLFFDKAGSALATGLQNANIASNGANTMSSAQNAAETSVGALRSFGLATTVKIHRNDFFTFLFGVAKFEQFISADFSIIDNSFALCNDTAIFLAAQLGNAIERKPSPLEILISKFFNPRHLIQSNSFAVTGTAIDTSCPQTLIRDNSISCPITAVNLNAPNCDALNNTLVGDPTQTSASSALLQVQYQANNVAIRGNRISNGPCNAILLVSDASGVVIDDNQIIGMNQNGITSADSVGSFNQLSISRNSISACSCGAAGGTFWQGGAIVLPELSDVRIIGNSIFDNLTSAATVDSQAIYLSVVTGADISQNLITGNFTTAPATPAQTGSIYVPILAGEILIHGNRIRGNGGLAVYLFNIDPAGSVSTQHNYVDNTAAAAANPDTYLVFLIAYGFLHFEDNMCFFTAVSQATYAVAVALESTHAIADGNTIQLTTSQDGTFLALEVDSSGLPGANAIITSNTVFGSFGTNLSSPVIANNLGF
jgi:hypothetical protein